MRKTVRSVDRPEHEILGRILKEAREDAGLTQRELAKNLDRSQAFVWKVETGFQHIDIPTLFDLATIVGKSPEAIISQLRSELEKSSADVESSVLTDSSN